MGLTNYKHPLVSIVVLNWNGLAYLKKTISPLLNLTYPNYEIIVVDNGSTDKSVDFLKRHKEIKLICNGKNFGSARGRNVAISAAKGEYVFAIDNDIFVRDVNIIEKLTASYKDDTGFIQVPLLDSGKTKTYYYGIYFSIYGLNLHRKELNIVEILNLKRDLIPIGGPTAGCFFCKKLVWEKIGGSDEYQFGFNNIDGVDIGPRAYLFGYKNYLFTKSYFMHLGINNAQSNFIYAERHKTVFSDYARSMIKNYAFINLLIRFPIFIVFYFLKTIRYSIKRKTIRVFWAYLCSIMFFIRHLPDTLKQRRKIQHKRVTPSDIFLKIKPPL